MRLAIVACDILKPEIEFLTKDDPDFVHREYLEYALHACPEKMRTEIIDVVNKLKGKVDAVFLGYAICQSLDGVTKVLDVPTVMLDGDDCIGAILGSREYAREKKICTGTWFSTPGWATEGKNGMIKELHLDCIEGVDPSFFMDMLFDSYERCLFIDTGIGNASEYQAKSEAFAEELRLKHDCRTCGLKNIEDAIKRTKEMAGMKS